MNILVAGLTGSGKTTCSRHLARSLGYEYLSGSELRLKLTDAASAERQSPGYWLSSRDAVQMDQERLQNEGDLRLDAELLRLAKEASQTVFDVWFLPWLPEVPGVKMLLWAPLEARAERVRTRISSRDRDLAPSAIALVAAKDARSREYGLKQFGIDVVSDQGPFDIILRTDAISSRALLWVATTLVRMEIGQVEAEDTAALDADMGSVIIRCPASTAEILALGALTDE